MKASVRWLRELLPALDASPRDLAARITAAGLEVEGIHEFGEATTSCLVAKVVSMRPHPTKSGLRLVTVDRGGAQQELVCGASNVPDPGGLVVLAPLGAHLPAVNMTIAKRAIAGVESEGMLCSEEELGLAESSDGILVLPEGLAAPGTPLATAVPNARDTILEIGLTPNRPDGLGHVGLAREIAALYGMPFAPPEAKVAETAGITIGDVVKIEVEDAERCPHYGAAVLTDVTVGPSSLAAKLRLQALGVRSISNMVDATNLVMFEHGQPVHAFDLDRLRPNGAARIVVRRAREGEVLTTLDGVERKLVADDLVIADGEGAVALAGVMGGASSEVHAGTKRVLLESAWFDPRSVRRTARRHGLHSEASHRFERGTDPGGVARVLERVADLGVTLAGAKVATGRLHVQGARTAGSASPPARTSLVLRLRRVKEIAGIDVSADDAAGILSRLGCQLVSQDDARVEVLLPSHRPDLGREVDLVEEVVRVLGMDAVPNELPAIRASRDVGGREALAERAREAAVALGLSEAITYGFTAKRTLEAMSAPSPAVVLANPLAEHHAVMRTSLLPGLFDVVRHARRQSQRDVRVFTIGRVFLPRSAGGGADAKLPEERLRLAVLLAGDRPSWLERPKPFDVWDLKGYALDLVTRLVGAGEANDVRVVADPKAAPHLHPRGAARLEASGTALGTFGPVHPDVEEALELDGSVLVLEIDLEPLLGRNVLPGYAPIPRFPAISRDVALVVRDEHPAGVVLDAIRAAAGPLVEDVQLFDRFVGGQVAAGSSSLAFHVVYRSTERTLTDAEVDAAHAKVVADVGSRFGATLRA